MKAITLTTARSKISALIDKVCKDHEPVIITRQKNDSVVLMSLEDYNSIEETFYLFKSPKNAARLTQAVKDFEKNKHFTKKLIKWK